MLSALLDRLNPQRKPILRYDDIASLGISNSTAPRARFAARCRPLRQR